MTTGTITPYLERPEDINPPKPEYFHDVFHWVHAYIELLRHVSATAIPGKGILKLYSYRTGTLALDTTVLEQQYTELLLNSRAQQAKLQLFANSLIAYNIQTLYQLLSNTLVNDLKRGFGDDQCLSLECIHSLNQFSKAQGRTTNSRIQLHDSMNDLVQTCHYNATYPRSGTSSSEAILRGIDALDGVFRKAVWTQPNTRTRLLDALKIVFYIGCRYYHLNLLRFSDEIIKRSYDRVLDITDFTLAAVPFDPTLVYHCADETSSISRPGIEYVQSLEAVLLYMGGVRYTAVLAVYANGNKGVSNV